MIPSTCTKSSREASPYYNGTTTMLNYGYFIVRRRFLHGATSNFIRRRFVPNISNLDFIVQRTFESLL